MKFLLKFFGWTCMLVVLAVIALLLSLPLWLGPVIKPVLKTAVPKYTKTSFDITGFELNPYTGRFSLGGVELGNPEGYPEPTAMSLGNFEFDVDMSSVLDPTIHIERLAVEDLYVTFVKGGADDVDNLSQIEYNIAGGKDKFEENLEVEKAETEKRRVQIEKINLKKIDLERLKSIKIRTTEDEKTIANLEREIAAEEKVVKVEEESADTEPRFVIDELVIKGIRVKFGKLPLAIPSITLHDVGKNSGGVTFTELGQEIWGAIMRGVGILGDGLKELSQGAISIGQDALDIGTNATATAVESLKKLDVDGAVKALKGSEEQLKNAGDALKGLFQK